tara:strand:- start:151 stop:813 length:663 start_codon:yes stop_codon:yes gene_type:complete
MFHWKGDKADIIKQDLATHGLSLFDYFDVRYVTLHKELLIEEILSTQNCMPGETLVTTVNGTQCILQFMPETRQIISEILGEDNPLYEDSRIIVYEIPKTHSLEPFLLLGSGWYEFEPEYNARATMKNSEILIVNPTNSEINITLNVFLNSIKNENTVTVSINNEKLNEIDVPDTLTALEFKNLILKPGVNILAFDTDEFMLTESKHEISFLVQSISIVD